MDSHHAHDSGSGSDGAEGTSSRRGREPQQQQQQQTCAPASLANTAVKADIDNSAAFSEMPPAAAGGSAGDGWAHNQQPPMTGPCKVDYCPTCGMPFEYCEFSGAACAKDEKQGQPLGHASGGQQADHEQQLADALEEKANISDAKRGSGKKAGSKPKVVTVQKQTKRWGKCATNIWGLEHFGVKQELAAKLASKQFACGSCFQKGQAGQASYVEIQGDVEESVAAFLLDHFNIPKDKIVFLAEK